MRNLYKYCLGDHEKINKRLREGRIPKVCNKLDKEILSLEKSPGLYFRGQTQDFDNLAQKEYVCYKSYTSITSRYSVAEAFSEGGIMIVMRCNTARDLRNYNLLSEEEFILPRGSMFKVANYIPAMRTFYLIEIS